MLWHCNHFNIVFPFDVMSDNVLQKKNLFPFVALGITFPELWKKLSVKSFP